MKKLLSLSFSIFLITAASAQTTTYDTTFLGWNARVTYDPAKLDSSEAIIFFPGAGEVGTDVTKLRMYGPHYWLLNGWNGSVALGNGVHYPILISLQPPNQSSKANLVKQRIDAILGRYRIKRQALNMTGPSAGGWYSLQYVSYQPTSGDHTYAQQVRSVVGVESVKPANIYDGTPAYPQNLVQYAQAGGKVWGFNQVADGGRDMLTYCKAMNDSVPGSATMINTNYSGGGHCCFEQFYDPSDSNWTASNANVVSLGTGSYKTMNVYQWMLRQGDTSVPIITPPPPADTVKKFFVQIYGGTNPYTNSAWNNWNTSASLSDSALKDTTGASSPIKVTLNGQLSVLDNGASYGAGATIFPQAVLRYCSYASTGIRTFTFTGLTPGKQYTFELMGSRGTTVNTEIFTIDTSISLVTTNNTTQSAIFGNISPDSTGKVIISFVRATGSAGTYVNGLKITQQVTTLGGMAVHPVASYSVASALQTSLQAEFKVFPNPVHETLVITFPAVTHHSRIQVIDNSGRILRTVSSDNKSSLELNVGDLQKGVYILRWINDQQTSIRKIIKD